MFAKIYSATQSANRSIVVAALGTTQTLAWASSYYLPAVLAGDIAAGAGISRVSVFGAFSASLLIAAFLGPAIGRVIDRQGGSDVLVASNIVLAMGLAVLSACQGIASLAVSWALLGIGMGLGLYDAAFATLTRIYGRDARGPITGITLIAGFASTIGWPLSAWLDAKIGWRSTCLTWAALHVIIGLPVNLMLIRRVPARAEHQRHEFAGWDPPREMTLLAFVFAASWFVTGAMAAHLPALLERMGASGTQAIAAAALVGPAQVAARLGEFTILRYAHPLVSARIAAALHPAGAVALAALGATGAAAFAFLHGAGNGLLTIARGTVPLAIFGPEGYGARTGLLGAPARMAQASAPILFGLLMDAMGGGVLIISGGLCLSALIALTVLRVGQERI